VAWAVVVWSLAQEADNPKNYKEEGFEDSLGLILVLTGEK
jgi:hypothetical protein